MQARHQRTEANYVSVRQWLNPPVGGDAGFGVSFAIGRQWPGASEKVWKNWRMDERA
jgi:hypothetical protein